MKFPLIRESFYNYNGILCFKYFAQINENNKIRLYISTNKKKSYDIINDWYESYPNNRCVYINPICNENNEIQNFSIEYQHPTVDLNYNYFEISDEDSVLLKNYCNNIKF